MIVCAARHGADFTVHVLPTPERTLLEVEVLILTIAILLELYRQRHLTLRLVCHSGSRIAFRARPPPIRANPADCLQAVACCLLWTAQLPQPDVAPGGLRLVAGEAERRRFRDFAE